MEVSDQLLADLSFGERLLRYPLNRKLHGSQKRVCLLWEMQWCSDPSRNRTWSHGFPACSLSAIPTELSRLLFGDVSYMLCLLPKRCRGLCAFSWHQAFSDPNPSFFSTRCQDSRLYLFINRKVAGSIPAGVIGIFHWHEILPIALRPWGRLSL